MGEWRKSDQYAKNTNGLSRFYCDKLNNHIQLINFIYVQSYN